MTQAVLASFDPLATHPFTNNSGLLPKPTPPSQFPHPIPSPLKTAATARAPSRRDTPATPIHAPQPSRAAHPKTGGKTAGAGAGRTQWPIFVPFRPERSSPELDEILLKKRFSDVFANKQPWSIDQAVPAHPARQ